MPETNYTKIRNSHVNPGTIYFWTATIHKWHHLLADDSCKQIVIDSLQYLSEKQLADVFAFVIMPNHLHMIWRVNGLNGKESSHGSFLKFTAHMFRLHILNTKPHQLQDYAVNAANKSHEFWQRDSLAVPLYTRQVAMQKLKYTHNNPLQEHWALVKDPCEYKYSSALYYEHDIKNFPFLKDLWLEL